MTVVAIGSTLLHLYRIQYGGYRDIAESAMTPPVSVLVPAYNEERTVVENVRALLAVDYPSHEIIVINDGSTDRTLKRLIDGFSLQPADLIYRPVIPTQRVKGFYTNPHKPNLIVVDKDNSGKADSLNVGINLARSPYFCCVDADTVLEKDALLRLIRPVIESKEPVVACGGILRIANGCTIRRGEIYKIALPPDILSNMQIVEYLRAFLFGRASWSVFNGLMVIAGAFSLFHKKGVQDVGGYSLETVSEDMELVVRLHRAMREKKVPYRIIFVSDPIGWTEVPTSFKMLKRQRMRWHWGLAESLFINMKMLFNPRYGLIGLLSMPYQFFIELIGPLIEVLGYIVVVLSFITGIIDLHFFMLFLSLALIYSIFLSAGAVLLEEITYRRYPRWSDMMRLLFTAAIENFGYRQLVSWWRVKAFLYSLFRRGKWEAIQKKGFKLTTLLVFLLLLFQDPPRCEGTAPQSGKSGGEHALMKETQDLPALLGRARFLKSQGRYQEAVEYFKQASELTPPGEAGGIKIEMATVLGWLGRHRESIRILTEVLETDPDNFDARLGLARSYGWAGMYDRAMGEYRSVLKRYPGNPDAQTGVSQILSWQGRFEEAIKGYEDVLAAAPDHPDHKEARLGLANVLRWKGDLNASLKEAKTLLSMDPANPEARKLVRQVREERGPVVSFFSAVSTDSDSNRLVTYKGTGYFNLGPLTKLNIDYSLFRASRFSGRGEASSLTLRDSLRASKDLMITPRVSLVSIDADTKNTYLTGGLLINWRFYKNWRSFLSYSLSPLLDNTQLMRNKIRVQEYSASLRYAHRDTTVTFRTAYGDYSDNNSRRDASLDIAGNITKEPGITSGYLLEYRDFEKSTHSGYFTPGNLLSNKLYFTLTGNIYREIIGYDMMGIIGTQSYDRKSEYASSFQAKVTGHLSPQFSIDGGYKWSRSALESAAGFRFKEYRFGLSYLF